MTYIDGKVLRHNDTLKIGQQSDFKIYPLKFYYFFNSSGFFLSPISHSLKSTLASHDLHHVEGLTFA